MNKVSKVIWQSATSPPHTHLCPPLHLIPGEIHVKLPHSMRDLGPLSNIRFRDPGNSLLHPNGISMVSAVFVQLANTQTHRELVTSSA